MMKAIALIGVVTLIACDPGPMPDVPRRLSDAELRKEWFPSDSYDPYPLDLAIGRDQLEEVRRLLESGADPNHRWSQSGDRFPLQEVIDTGGLTISNDTDIVRLLLKHGADPNAKWCPFETRGSWSPWGVPNCRSASAMTGLMYATLLGRRDITELLLQAGADPLARNWSGRSALEYADDEIIFELISRALFPDLATRDRQTLDWLTRADELTDPGGKSTPLVRALSRNDVSLTRMLGRVRSLLRIGADPNQRVTADRTPLSYTLTRGGLRVTRVLLQAGADANQRWCEPFVVPFAATDASTDSACTIDKGITPLMWCARMCGPEAVALLLEFKADRTLKDWAGRSVLHYAETREIWDLLKTAPWPPH